MARIPSFPAEGAVHFEVASFVATGGFVGIRSVDILVSISDAIGTAELTRSSGPRTAGKKSD